MIDMSDGENEGHENDVPDGTDNSEIDEESGEHVEATTGSPRWASQEQVGQQPDLEPLLENLEEITALVREWFEQSRENKRVENEGRQLRLEHRERIIYTAAIAFIAVVLVSAGMTWADALSGDAFTFVLGTLFGAILTFLQTMLGGSQSEG